MILFKDDGFSTKEIGNYFQVAGCFIKPFWNKNLQTTTFVMLLNWPVDLGRSWESDVFLNTKKNTLEPPESGQDRPRLGVSLLGGWYLGARRTRGARTGGLAALQIGRPSHLQSSVAGGSPQGHPQRRAPGQRHSFI